MSTPPRVSVVIPARDAGAHLGDCLRAVRAQSLPASEFEVIAAVDDRSLDRTVEIARVAAGVTVIVVDSGPSAARNAGLYAASGQWVAFTDADCIPSRGWLRALLAAVEPGGGADVDPGTLVLGAAGPTIGYLSATPAARFVDLTGGLQAERHLRHERYPWAPTANVMYRRDGLLAVGGFDARFLTYEGCDLHTRLRREIGGAFMYAPRAVVHHRHRAGWRAYWRQQLGYGRGYGQFFRRYAAELEWTPLDELRAWYRLELDGLRAATPGRGDAALVRRGGFVKRLAQQIGFSTTYWRAAEARRWRVDASADAGSGT